MPGGSSRRRYATQWLSTIRAWPCVGLAARGPGPVIGAGLAPLEPGPSVRGPGCMCAKSKPCRQLPPIGHEHTFVNRRCVQGTSPLLAGYRSPGGAPGALRAGGDACRTTWSPSHSSWCVTTSRTADRERSPRASGPVSATSVGRLSTTASASTESSAALPARWWSTAGAACVALGAGWSGCSTSRCRRSDCVDTGRR